MLIERSAAARRRHGAVALAFLALLAGVLPAASAASAAAAATATAAVDALQPAGRWMQPTFGNAPLPPMGWNSWNAFHTQIDEAKLVGSAQAIVDFGLRDLGYRYINIDDGWWQKRRQPDGRMVVRTSIFPSAKGASPEDTSFRLLVDRLHAMGLKAGIYSDIGRNACSQGYPSPDSLLPTGTVAEREVGLYEHLNQDMKLYFQEWGFDYIKVDGCGLNAFSPDKPAVKAGQFRAFPAMVVSDAVNQTQVDNIRNLYGEVRDAIKGARPAGDFIFSICNWGTANVRAWGHDYGNLWRTSDDIEPRWASLLRNLDSVITRELYSGPGHWNDPDMLYIGQGDFDANHLTEAHTHFALWSILDAPLLIGYDLRQAPPELLAVLGAPEVVAVNQDPAGNQAVLAYTSDDFQILVKQLSTRNEKAVVLFNRGTERVQGRLTAAHLKFRADSPIQVRDLWSRKDLPAFTGETPITLEPRQSVMFRVKGVPQLADGQYLSEMPARVYVAVDGIRVLQSDPQIHRPVSLDEGRTRGSGIRPVLAGWGGPRADSTPYDNELRLHGVAFASGIGALANSRLQVRTAAEFNRFTAQVGVDDSSLERHVKVRFEVYGDGRLLAQSPQLAADAAVYNLDVPVAGVKTLELVARAMARDAAPLVVTWGAAALHR